MLRKILFTLSLPAFLMCTEVPPTGTLITPHAIAANPANGKVYVVDTQHAGLTVIDTRSNTEHYVSTGAGPVAVAIDFATGRVYVANSGAGTVAVLDGQSDTVLATVPVGPHPYTLAVNSRTHCAYVTNTFSSILSVINGTTNTVRQLKLGSFDNVAVDERTNRIFLLSYENPNIQVLDGEKETITKIQLANHLWSMAVNEQTGIVYVTAIGSKQLWSIHESNNEAIPTPVGHFPCAVAIDKANNQVYVVNYGDNSVTRVDANANQTAQTLPVGNRPQAVAVDSSSHTAYVLNTKDNSVTILRAKSVHAETAPAGNNPFALTVATNHSLYIANLDAKTYTRIQ